MPSTGIIEAQARAAQGLRPVHLSWGPGAVVIGHGHRLPLRGQMVTQLIT